MQRGRQPRQIQESLCKLRQRGKETGRPILENGGPITAETVFIPKEENGTIEVKFTFNSVTLAGKQIVVFESLYDGNAEVAVHADIDDNGQTVSLLVETNFYGTQANTTVPPNDEEAVVLRVLQSHPELLEKLLQGMRLVTTNAR